MGLDSYFRFYAAPGETAPTANIQVSLCGGMMSGADNGSSFRGKVYDDIVSVASDGAYTLYEEEQGPTTVSAIGEALQAYLDANPDVQEFGDYQRPRKEVEDLALAFKTYGNLGFGLMGWW